MDTLKLLVETRAMLDRVDRGLQPALWEAMKMEYLRLLRIHAVQRQLDERPTLRIWSDANRLAFVDKHPALHRRAIP